MKLIAKDIEATYNSQQLVLTGVDVAGFSKVFSTMWGGSLYGRFEASAVFMVLLSLCDKDGTVDMTPEAIAGQTGWPVDLIRKGIAELASPDPRSRTPDAEGRRILPLDGHRDWGWRITNYKKYREEMRSAERREYLRQAKEQERLRKKSTSVNTVNQVNQCQPIAEAEAEADKNNVSRFALFWSSWPNGPRKTAKKQCLAKWISQGCEADADRVMAALEWFKASEQWVKDGGAFVPMPMTWLNRRSWEIEIPKGKPQSTYEESQARMKEWDEQAKQARSPESIRARELALSKLKVFRG